MFKCQARTVGSDMQLLYRIVTVVVLSLLSTSVGQSSRRVTLVAADNTRQRIEANSPTLPASIDARSIRVPVNGGLCHYVRSKTMAIRV